MRLKRNGLALFLFFYSLQGGIAVDEQWLDKDDDLKPEAPKHAAKEDDELQIPGAGDGSRFVVAEFGDVLPPSKDSAFPMLFEGLDVIVTAMIAVIIVFIFIFKIPTIDGSSMNDTLFNGERVVISDLFYEPKYGDIVVISRNFENTSKQINQQQMPIIKRVIATEGQQVNIVYEADGTGREVGTVYVDGVALDEPYIKEPMDRTRNGGDVVFPVTVPENCIFVLGDNRNDSKDSRYLSIGDGGMIDKRYVMGKALFRVFPFNKFGKIGK